MRSGNQSILRQIALVLGDAAVIAMMASLETCARYAYPARFVPPDKTEELDRAADFLKCHMRDGRVYVLSRWSIDGDAAKGEGRLYNAQRDLVTEGSLRVPLADVALFETDRPEKIPHSTGSYVVMGVVSVASASLSVYCATNPKACFGSCPTFYAETEGGGVALQAEGFSASVVRSLEETDVDALWTARARSSTFDVVMTNEALETHVVDSVRLLAVPRAPGTRVLRAGDAYFAAREPTPPIACEAASGDCLAAVVRIDGAELSSLADERDLATKETVDLSFPLPESPGPLGVVVAARNSLLNTFVFYQALAYLGRGAGAWYAHAEIAPPERDAGEVGRLRAFGRLLGDIGVSVARDDGTWRLAGAYAEVGPIAREVQLVPIGERPETGPLRVRLTMTKGNWRIDNVALVALAEQVTPRALLPARVRARGRDDPDALSKLAPGGAHLVTYPGDAYELRFALPPGDHELFLESRGYYYEWMRQAWLADESPLEVLRILSDPAAALRALAPRYKTVEPEMDRLFWNSRVAVQR
jgi:hypothetical protein